jgi:hypothetical protein
MVLVASAVKLVAEIALLSLMGQGVLYLLAGSRRDQNLFYQLFQVLTRPFMRLARWVSPRVVLDRHVPIVAFLLLAFAWAVATLSLISLCLQSGVNTCQ